VTLVNYLKNINYPDLYTILLWELKILLDKSYFILTGKTFTNYLMHHSSKYFLTNNVIYTVFQPILENIKNNKLIFQILEMSLNFTKSGNDLEKILAVKKKST